MGWVFEIKPLNWSTHLEPEIPCDNYKVTKGTAN